MSNVPFSFGGGQTAFHQPQQAQQNGQTSTINGAPVSGQAQQQPLMPAATLPPELLAALQGIAPEQLGAIFQAFKSGLIPMPPVNLTPTQPAQTTPINDPRLPPNPAPAPNGAPTTSASNHDVDMDQEDGEIEDGELDNVSTPHTRGFLRTPPKGPRDSNSRRGSHQYQQQTQQASRPGLTQRASSSTVPRATMINGKAPALPSVGAKLLKRPTREDACKTFIREMHLAGYTYDDLAREVKDHKMLRRVYEQLSLPIPSSSTTKALAVPETGSYSVDAGRKQIPAKPTKAPPPKDRSEYLAKLQAAKAKKTEAAKASATLPAATQAVQPAMAQPVQAQVQTQKVTPTQPAKAAPPKSSVATPPAVRVPVMSKEKTNEVRRRLEAIKAKRAAEQSAKLSSDVAQPGSQEERPRSGMATPQQAPTEPDVGRGASLVKAAAMATNGQGESTNSAHPQQPVVTGYQASPSVTASPVVNRGLNLPGLGLPGLFASFAPPSTSQTSSPQPLPSAPPAFAAPGLPASASIVVPVTAPSPTTTQHITAPTPTGANFSDLRQQTFGQRNNTRSTERCVIEVSSDDDDDDGDDMDIDESSEDEHKPRIEPPVPASAKDVARPSSLSKSGSSAPGTPDAYKRKLEEIERFKQQIAVKEKKRKLQNFPSAHAVDSVSITAPTPNGGVSEAPTQDANISGAALAINELHGQPTPHSPVPKATATLPSPAAVAATKLARAHEKEALQRRLRELEALRSKHGSGSPALAQPTVAITAPSAAESAHLVTQSTAKTTTAAFNSTTSTDDIDDEDDEDLYGNDTNGDTDASYHQEAQDTHVPPHIGFQTRFVSSNPQPANAEKSVEAERPASAEDAIHAVEVDRALGEQRHEATALDTAAFREEEHEYDDDDLDDIYEPSPIAEQAVPQPKALVANTTSSNENDDGSDDDDDDDDAMDTSEESSDEDDEEESDFEPEDKQAIAPAPQLTQQVSAIGPDPGESVDQQMSDIDIPPELQPARDQVTMPSSMDKEMPETRYTPYESPLRRFKDYRYHSEFTNIVPTGFKSLTFNHKIDPVKPICPFELENGQCNNANCGYQHFHEMNLHDNDLLRLMGTERTPARNPEEEQRWKEGLSNLIRELRTTNVGRDAGLIAQRIAEYRRSFVNDPTRVLLLDD